MNKYIFTTIFSMLELMQYYVCFILLFRWKLNRMKIVVPCYFIMPTIMTNLCCMLFGEMNAWMYLVLIVSSIVFPIACKEKRKYRFILHLPLAIVIPSIGNILIEYIFIALNADEIQRIQTDCFYILGMKAIVLTIMTLLGFFLREIGSKRSYDNLFRAKIIYGWISIFCILMILGTNQLELLGMEFGKNWKVMNGVITTIASIVFIISTIWHAKLTEKIGQFKEREIRYEYLMHEQESYFQQLMVFDKDVRKFRHDIRAHLLILHSFAESGKYEEIEEYLQHLLQKQEVCGQVRYSGNVQVDAIISDLKKQMEELSIELICEGTFVVDDRVPTFDLCTIFYNLLNNAIAACDKIENDERQILMKFGKVGDRCLVSIINTCVLDDSDSFELLPTDKEDEINHGFGMKNVQEAVNRNNGKIHYSIKNHKFIVDFII